MVRKGWMHPLVDGFVLGYFLTYFLMKEDIITWNCQGAGKSNFHIILNEYLRKVDLDVVYFLEIRVSGPKAKNVIHSISLSYSHRLDA